MTTKELHIKIQEQDVLACLPKIGISERNQNIVQEFAAGKSCADIGAGRGLTGNVVNEIIKSAVLKTEDFNKFFDLCEKTDVKTVIEQSTDLCRTDKEVLLALAATRSSDAAASITHRSNPYILKAVHHFFRTTSEEYRTSGTRPENIGARLRELREQAGLNLKQAAEKAKISEKSLARYEDGTVKQSVDILLVLVEQYEADLAYLFPHNRAMVSTPILGSNSSPR